MTNQYNYIQILAKAFNSDHQLLYLIWLIILAGVLPLLLVKVVVWKLCCESCVAVWCSLVKVVVYHGITKLSTDEDHKVCWWTHTSKGRYRGYFSRFSALWVSLNKFQFMFCLTGSQPNFKISDKSAYSHVTKLAAANWTCCSWSIK